MNTIQEEEIIIGIDYGTSNLSIITYFENKIEFIPFKNNDIIFPSKIILENNETHAIENNDIFQRLEKYNDNIIYDIKRFIGLNYNELNEKDFYKNLFYEIKEINEIPKIEIKDKNKNIIYLSAEEILSLHIKEVLKIVDNHFKKEFKNRRVNIAIPKFFSDEQKQAFESAVKSAGIENYNIIDESFYEIIGYTLGMNLIENNNKEKINEKNILIFDLGGGKSDINIINIKVNNEGNIDLTTLISDCDLYLGGSDFDDKLIDYCINIFCSNYNCKEEDIRKNKNYLMNLKILCEETKKNFYSSNNEQIISIKKFFENYQLYIKITPEKYEELCKPLYKRIRVLINNSFKRINRKLDEIDDIILIGRGSRIIGIKKLFIEIFRKEKIKQKFKYDKIIPLCLIIKSLQLKENIDITFNPNYYILENIGISNNNNSNEDEKEQLMVPIFKKYQKLPSINKSIFEKKITEIDKGICIEIYEGNDKYTRKNKKIGEFIFGGNKGIDIKKYIVEFSIDKFGKLKIALEANSKKVEKDIANLNVAKINKKEKKIIKINPKKIHNLNTIFKLFKLLKERYLIEIKDNEIIQNSVINIISNISTNISIDKEQKEAINDNQIKKINNNIDKEKAENKLNFEEKNLKQNNSSQHRSVPKESEKSIENNKNKKKELTKLRNIDNNDIIESNQITGNNNLTIEKNNKSKQTVKNSNTKQLDIVRENKNQYIDINENIFETENLSYFPIENGNNHDRGIIKLILEYGDNKIKIIKDLIKNVNSFIACIGPPGAGKSTFCSNYYKYLYKVKSDYFESSSAALTFTKGIWMINDYERRKIPIMIKKDLLDVEGFQVDNIKCWKYVMIIAFLSTDLIILNRNARYDDVKKVIKIIENSLKKMMNQKIPRIIRNIYIQMKKNPN